MSKTCGGQITVDSTYMQYWPLYRVTKTHFILMIRTRASVLLISESILRLRLLYSLSPVLKTFLHPLQHMLQMIMLVATTHPCIVPISYVHTSSIRYVGSRYDSMFPLHFVPHKIHFRCPPSTRDLQAIFFTMCKASWSQHEQLS